MRLVRQLVPMVVLLALAWLAGPVLLAADPAAAERQYRVARRLVVEGSPEATAALQKVIELDPEGKLVDDSLVDQALLLGIPRWPEDVGSLEGATAQQAMTLLTRVTDEFSLADRALQARYLRALLKLEPLASYDASDAGLELITAATAREPLEWAHAARYALGWLAEQQTQLDRARNAYQRLVVDAPGGAAATRARTGLGRMQLRDGRFGPAASLFEEALLLGAPPELHADSLKEAAVRALLAQASGSATPRRGEALASATGVRALMGMAATPDGGVLLGGERIAAAIRYDAAGTVVGRWSLIDIQAVAVDPFGNAYAAAGDKIFQLRADQAPRTMATQGDFTPVTALAVDGTGRLWILDRRGEQIGKIEPGVGSPVPFGNLGRARLSALAWDGRRLLALNTKDRTVVAIGADGAPQKVASAGLLRPQALAAGPAGQIAVLDGKNRAAQMFDSSGSAIGAVSWGSVGMEKASAVSLAQDGSLLLFDPSSQRCVRVP